MDTQEVVNTPLTMEQVEETPVADVEDSQKSVRAGDKTDPNLLLKSVQDERERRRVAEDKIALLEEELNQARSLNLSNEEPISDEGKLLDGKIKEINSQLEQLKKENAKKDVIISYPAIKENSAEFDEFLTLPENKGINIKTAAKVFLAEKGLIDTPRKGLEKPTGGDKSPAPSGVMTAEEVKHLRETDYKKYSQMVVNNQIKIG